ncbi:hypothetical protein Hte_007730 [Hypoxylon texense]
MRSFVAILAVAASLQSGSAAPVADEQHTTLRTITHGGFPHPTGGFPHPTGGIPHPTGGPRRPGEKGPWVRDAEHRGGPPHPKGTGHAHATGGHHTGKHHSTHSGVAKPTGAPHKREEKHKPWGHGTGGIPHPTGGHHTGHHTKHSSGAAKPTGAPHMMRDEQHHKPGGAHPTGGFPHPTGGFAHPTGGAGHGHGKGNGKTATTTTTSAAAQATGEKRAEDGHGPFTWPHGGFPTSVSFPTLPLPTGVLPPHPTGFPHPHPRPGDDKKPAAREAAAEEPEIKRGGDTTLDQVLDIARNLRQRPQNSQKPFQRVVIDVLRAEDAKDVKVDGKPAKDVAAEITKGEIKLPPQ